MISLEHFTIREPRTEREFLAKMAPKNKGHNIRNVFAENEKLKKENAKLKKQNKKLKDELAETILINGISSEEK